MERGSFITYSRYEGASFYALLQSRATTNIKFKTTTTALLSNLRRPAVF